MGRLTATTATTAITMLQFGQLPALRIRAPDGAEAIVTLYGAHLVSWKDAAGSERLFCSARSALDGSRAIRGGVPVIFPQFAERGSGMRHGFARVSHWHVADSGVADGTAFAVFTMTAADLAPALAQAWPHRFALELRVAVNGNELHLSLTVLNTGDSSFAFAAALHTYYLVDQLGAVRIDGVQEAPLAIADKFDAIYYGIERAIELRSGTGALRLEQGGFRDAVVWNPGALDAAALADLEAAEYQRFVCIEPALVDPLTLQPGQAWCGRHRVGAFEK
jgi:glucose-6-phosphate 1-epimerase